MGYFKDTLRGLTYKSLSRVSIRIIGFLKIAVIARMLGPVEFGLFGIASLVLALLDTMTEAGINVFLIQENDKYKKYINSAYIISLFRGIAISLLIISFTPLIEMFFNIDNVNNILLLIAIVPFIRGFINPAIVKYEKDLLFNKELYLRLFLYVIDMTVSIAFALKYPIAESLIVGMVVSVMLEVLFSWIFISPTPRFVFNKGEIKYIIKSGRWVTLTGIFNYLFHNIDDMIVGKFFGVYSLGIYQLSYKLATILIYETGEIFGRVTLPIYSKIAGDRKRLRIAFYKITLAISILSISSGLILIIYTKEIVFLVFGSKWLDAVNVIKVLAIFSIMRSISGSVTPLFYAIKRQSVVTRFMLAGLIALLILIFPLIKLYGLTGAAMSTVLATIVTFPFIWFPLKKEIL